MYKTIKVLSLLTLMLLMTLSCNGSAQVNKKSADDEITSISYRRTAGRGGSESIVATKDSLTTSATGRMAETYPNFKRKMNAADWEKLVSMINISTLKTTVSGEGRGHYDGPDEFYEIKTAGKTYSLVNVQDSVKAKQLTQVKNFLKKMTVAK